MATIYQPLVDHLATQPSEVTEVNLTFGQVTAIVGFALPASASTRQWWANSRHTAHATAWVAVGWQVIEVTTRDRTPVVAFERIAAADTTTQPSPDDRPGRP